MKRIQNIQLHTSWSTVGLNHGAEMLCSESFRNNDIRTSSDQIDQPRYLKA